MKFIIINIEFGREYYDKEFDSVDDAWDFLREQNLSSEHFNKMNVVLKEEEPNGNN